MRTKDGIFYFSVISDGATGSEWINRLKSKGYLLNEGAIEALLSKDFRPTNGVTTEVGVLPGLMFEDEKRYLRKIQNKSFEHNLVTPGTEIACLIREKLTDDQIEAMGIGRILVMHTPVRGGDYDVQFSFTVSCTGAGDKFEAYYQHIEDNNWGRDYGFAYVVSAR